MKRLLIEPLDVLMFRNERPFFARESHVAKTGVISPLTFEGALKSKMLLQELDEKYVPSDFQREKNEDENVFRKRISETLEKDENLRELLEVLGHPTVRKESSINVLGAFFFMNGTECFPMPNDIVKKAENQLLKITPVLKNEMKIPKTDKYACFSQFLDIGVSEGLIHFDALVEYSHGKKPDKSWRVEKPYLLEERPGIKLERGRKTTVRGYLYIAEFLRLKEKCSFVVWYESKSQVKIPEGVLRLGGEGRGAVCRKIDEVNLAEKLRLSKLIDEINNEGRFKLYLASPSYFGGYEPPTDELQEVLGVNRLNSVAALPAKPVYIGGYNFALNKEKPLRRWVNAGAVYYYKFEGKIRNDLNLPLKIINGHVDMRCAFMGRW